MLYACYSLFCNQAPPDFCSVGVIARNLQQRMSNQHQFVQSMVTQTQDLDASQRHHEHHNSSSLIPLTAKSRSLHPSKSRQANHRTSCTRSSILVFPCVSHIARGDLDPGDPGDQRKPVHMHAHQRAEHGYQGHALHAVPTQIMMPVEPACRAAVCDKIKCMLLLDTVAGCKNGVLNRERSLVVQCIVLHSVGALTSQESFQLSI